MAAENFNEMRGKIGRGLRSPFDSEKRSVVELDEKCMGKFGLQKACMEEKNGLVNSRKWLTWLLENCIILLSI